MCFISEVSLLKSEYDVSLGGAGVSEVLPERLPSQERKSGLRRELITFFVLAFGIWPIVAVGVVGGYGFLVWMFQIIYGPPGPPGH